MTSDLVTDQRVHRICSTLHEANYDILLVGRKLSSSPKLPERAYKTRRFQLPFEKGMLFYLSFNVRLFRFLMNQPADALWSNDLDTLPANFLASKLRGIPLIYDSHEFFTEVPELVNRKLKRSIWKLAERLTFRSAKLRFTVSAAISAAYQKIYNCKVDVLRNLPRKYEISAYQQNEKYRIADPDKFRILFYQGSVNVSRGLEELIDAMAFLPLCKLFIAGDGDVKVELQSRIELVDWKERVVFLGRVDPEELRYYTVQADLGISIEKADGLSYTYALPNKFFDYVQAGVPVLISELPELLKLNRQIEVAEVISGHDPQSIADTILQLFAQTDRWKKLQENTLKAREEWTWEKEQVKLLQSVAQLFGQGESD